MWRGLDRCDIPTHCSVGWDSLTGTAQVRYCGQCQKEVHNLSALTGKEIEALVAKHKGQLCVTLARDGNGRLLTLDPRTGFRRRFVKITGAMLAALLSVAPVVARPRLPVTQLNRSAETSGRPFVQIEPRPKTGKTILHGKVVGPYDHPFKGAKITLSHKNGPPVYRTKTNKDGMFRLTGVLPGEYTLQVTAEWFEPFSSDIKIEKGQTLSVNASLTKFVGPVGSFGYTSRLQVLLQIVKAPFKALKKIFR